MPHIIEDGRLLVGIGFGDIAIDANLLKPEGYGGYISLSPTMKPVEVGTSQEDRPEIFSDDPDDHFCRLMFTSVAAIDVLLTQLNWLRSKLAEAESKAEPAGAIL